jgi:hypothetical protein
MQYFTVVYYLFYQLNFIKCSVLKHLYQLESTYVSVYLPPFKSIYLHENIGLKISEKYDEPLFKV